MPEALEVGAKAEAGRTSTSIDLADVEAYADISEALRSYYAGAVEEVAAKTGVAEGGDPDWFETQLITEERFRSQTRDWAGVRRRRPGRSSSQELEAAYLIRSDTRAGMFWYELTHDMLVEPILDDNLAWKRRSSSRGSWRRESGGTTVATSSAAARQRSFERRPAQRAETARRPELESRLPRGERARREGASTPCERCSATASFVGALAIVECIVIVDAASCSWCWH